MSTTMIIVIIIFILIFTSVIAGFMLSGKKIGERNRKAKEENQRQYQEIEDIIQKKKAYSISLQTQISELITKKNELENKYNILNKQNEMLYKENKFLQDQIDDFDKSVDKAKELSNLKIAEINAGAQESFSLLEEQYNNLKETYLSKIQSVENTLQDLKEKRDAAIQQAINDYEDNLNKNFYVLQITDKDLNDITLLREISNKINKKEVIGKIIYKVYIEKYYTDLIGRVLDNKSFSGVYKITNQINQMCYVGQAVDIKKRWLQHIKRAIGAEPLINNKLYPAMQKYGIENFSFEVIDRCDKDKLNEREKYWQNFYKAKSFGYSIK